MKQAKNRKFRTYQNYMDEKIITLLENEDEEYNKEDNEEEGIEIERTYNRFIFL